MGRAGDGPPPGRGPEAGGEGSGRAGGGLDGLTRARWREIDALLEKALERPPDERPAYVEREAGGDRELFREVVALLALEPAAGDVIGESATDFAPEVMAGLGQELAPVREGPEGEEVRIGPYRLLSEIGRGGMGTVHLAERDDDEYRRRVAVKLVRRGMEAEEILRRFRHERQILASLEHADIARLYDGGVTEDGRPFLVMEYVEGRPVDEYCDEEGLGVRERLALFRRVCRAVQYAHQNLVVHRDLKPSNILVTEDGAPKLLDFGIAKLLSPEEGEGSALRTRTGVRVLTPRYASPEQVRGEAVTTASDVYALGVLLYHLLTGEGPYPSTTTPRETERAVLETEPPLPSAAAGDASPGEAAARGTTPDGLRRRLRGDLDNIVLKALEKDPESRYATARELEEDLRRHLEGRPVAARAATLRYRAGKFLRRHRAGVAAAALLVLSLAGGLGAALWQADRAARERDTAEEVSRFLEDLFEAPDPYAVDEERLDTLRVADFLALGTERVRRELAEEPVVQARLLGVLGNVHRNLGLLEEAEGLLRASLEERLAARGPDHPEVAESRHDLAAALADRAEYEEAERLYREALEIRRRAFGDRDSAVAETLRGLASLLTARSEFDEAEALVREALEIRRSLAGPDGASPDVAGALMTLSGVLRARGDHQAALDRARESLEIQRAVREGPHPAVGVALSNVATLLVQLGRPEEAREPLRESLAIYRETLGEDHPRVAVALNTLGSLLTDLGEWEASEAALRESLEIRRRLYGEEDPRVATLLNNLGYLAQRRGDLEEAEAFYRESLALRRRVHGDDHMQIVIGLNSLAVVLKDRHRFAEAEPLAREAAEIAARLAGEESPTTAVIRGNLGSVLAESGRHEEAAPIFARSLEVLEAKLPPEHPRTARMRLRLGAALRELGRYELAEPLLLEAEEALSGGSGSVEELVALYAAWGRPEAEAEWRARLEGSG